jgi:hypothetical protein
MKKISTKFEWKKPVELRDVEEVIDKEIVIRYNDNFSHYGILWQVVETLTKRKFASRKEIMQEWKAVLEMYL